MLKKYNIVATSCIAFAGSLKYFDNLVLATHKKYKVLLPGKSDRKKFLDLVVKRIISIKNYLYNLLNNIIIGK